MKTPYRFTKRKRSRYYEVMFAHIPGRWFSTKSETLEGAIDFARSQMEGKGDKRDLTLRQFAEGFFGPEDPHGYRHRLERRGTFYLPSYYEQHAGRLDKYILKAHGGWLLSAINDTMIEDFILDIPRLANSTRNKILSCYRIVLREAVREGYIRENPADRVKELPAVYTARDVFSEEEMRLMFPDDDEAVIRFWGNLKWAVYFCILKDTGWRPAEVAGLAKENWFPELQGIYTTRSVDWRTHKLKEGIKTTRKGQPFKEGFLSEQTSRLMSSLVATCPDEMLFHLSGRGHREDLIYPECANKHMRYRCAIANMPLHGRTQYCFRHTFNTRALGNLPEVARLILMGHTSNRQEYNHLTPKQALERVLSIEGVKETLGIKKEGQ